MTGGPGLERGYRRLLACYPRRFRDEHGEELVAVLLASARAGQHRPGLIECTDLVRNGLGMRLRPDVSPCARQGWSDALAAYSLVAPVLLLVSTALTGALLPLSLNLHPVSVMSLVWPGLCATLAIEAVVIALVMASWRKTALAAIVATAAYLLYVGGPLNLWTGLSVCLLEAAALIASPGPRHGRRLVHWGHWTVLLVAAAAPACLAAMLFRGQGSLAALGVMVVLILAFNRLGRALRLSRYFRLLLVATFYPVVFVAATWDLGVLGGPSYLAVAFAGPLLCAAVAMGTAIRPRRRRII